MTHIAIQEKRDGKAVDWMEHVTDEQYREAEECSRRLWRAACSRFWTGPFNKPGATITSTALAAGEL